MFKRLTTNPKINYSRYHFFHANYLISIEERMKAKSILQTSLKLYPKNLILNQLQTDLNQEQKSSNEFNCKKMKHIKIGRAHV